LDLAKWSGKATGGNVPSRDSRDFLTYGGFATAAVIHQDRRIGELNVLPDGKIEITKKNKPSRQRHMIDSPFPNRH
jgi:hypothetical protein